MGGFWAAAVFYTSAMAALAFCSVDAPRSRAATVLPPISDDTPPPLPTSTQNGYFINLDAVHQVACDSKALGPDVGTSFVISRDTVLTAAHVVSGEDTCSVDGKDAKVTFEDDKIDVAVLHVDLGDGPIMQTSCEGFKGGEEYFAVGYAQGADFAMQLLRARGTYKDVQTDREELEHGAKLDGRVFPGMSGGPIVDTNGRVTGVVSAGTEERTYARDLIDTSLCAMLKAPDTKPATNPVAKKP